MRIEDRGKCRCGGCGKAFRRLSTFDSHRIGLMADRRCLTGAELLEMGFREDSQGFWRTPAKVGRIWPRDRALVS